MIGIIVTGHGSFAQGMASALALITGTPSHFIPVCFPEGESPTVLERHLQEALSQLADCQGILILIDLLGGTPFHQAAVCAAKDPKIRLVYGANAVTLLESVGAREEFSDIEELAQWVASLGKKQMGVYQPKELQEDPME